MNNLSFVPALGYNLVCINLGRLAQMVERLPYTQNVGGSIPSAPTSFPNPNCFSSIGFLVPLDPPPSTLASLTSFPSD